MLSNYSQVGEFSQKFAKMLYSSKYRTGRIRQLDELAKQTSASQTTFKEDLKQTNFLNRQSGNIVV